MSWCKAHTLRERIVRTSLRACHENRNRKNLVKLVLQKISLYRERVVTCPRQTRSPDRPSPLITDPLIGIFRYERGNEGWTEAALTESEELHFLERISDSLVAREVAVTAWKLQLHRETISLPLSPALYLAYRPHPFTRPCTLSLLVFVSRIIAIIAFKFIYSK